MAAIQYDARQPRRPTGNPPPLRPFNNTKAKHQNRDAWLKRNTGAEIITIHINDLQPDPAVVNREAGSETVCSYNWRNAATLSIYVPGAPPKWTPKELPITLPEDEGGRYIDQNAHRVPDFPFEPMFQAMSVMNPDINLGSVDFIANRNSLRNLLNFINGRVWDPFRIDLDMVNNTLFLTRRSQFTKELPGPTRSGRGYGHNFETSFTAPEYGLEDSTSHHRVAKYKLGDLECVVRYEVDAWITDDTDGKTSSNHDKVKTTIEQDPDELLSSLKGLSLSDQDKATDEKLRTRGTKVMPRGTPVDPTNLAELKTKGKDPRMSDFVPQLWFGRIPYLALGIHDNGCFKAGKITITKTAELFEKFEQTQQDQLRKLVALIKILKKETSASNGKSMRCGV